MSKRLFSLFVLMALVLPVLTFAADIRSAEVVGKSEKVRNLYVAGQNPSVDADVTGDLVAAGGNVTVNGSVENSLLIAGGTVIVNGAIGGSIRAAGGTVTVESKVAGDVVVFGGDVILGTNSVVTGDVIVFAGTATLKGSVLGSVKSSGVGSAIISGTVAGGVEFMNAGELRIESSAVVNGTVKYSSQKEATVATGAKVGKVEYTKIAQMKTATQSMSDSLGGVLVGMVMAFVSLLVLIKLLPKFSKAVLDSSLDNSWSKLGIGLLTMVVTPVALLLLLITFVGWGLMGYLGLAYMVFFALTGSLAALLVGAVSWKYIRKEETLVVDWKTAGVGVILLGTVKMIPVIGWIAALAVGSIVYGSLVVKAYEFVKGQRV